MPLIVAARLWLNALAAAVYLVRGQRENWSAVWRAHKDFRKMVREGLRESRRTIQSCRKAKPAGIYRGSILLAYLFGKRRFSEFRSLE